MSVVLPHTPATHLTVVAAIDEQTWGYLADDGKVYPDGSDPKATRFAVDRIGEAESAAAELRHAGYESVKVLSDARY